MTHILFKVLQVRVFENVTFIKGWLLLEKQLLLLFIQEKYKILIPLTPHFLGNNTNQTSKRVSLLVTT